LGFLAPLIPFLAEMTPKEGRGQKIMYFMMSYTLGEIIAIIISYS